MDETQHFRLAGTTTVEKIDYDHVDGHNVIYWEDIELVFPGVKHVKCNDVTVKPLRDSNRNRSSKWMLNMIPWISCEVALGQEIDHLPLTKLCEIELYHTVSSTTQEWPWTLCYRPLARTYPQLLAETGMMPVIPRRGM